MSIVINTQFHDDDPRYTVISNQKNIKELAFRQKSHDIIISASTDLVY